MQELTNPIARQSREWLTRAMLELMAEQDYKTITVTEIAARAGLSRRTFYRIFASKDDILEYYTDQLYDAFMQSLQQESEQNFAVIVRLYFEFWYAHRDFLDLLRRNDLLPFMMSQYSRLFPAVFKIVKCHHPLAHHPAALDYAMAFSSGGLLSILLKWAEDGMDRTPDEITGLIEYLLA